MKAEKLQSERVRFITNAAYWLVILAIVYFIFKYFLNLVMPFFIALIVAALSRPITHLICKDTEKVQKEDGTVVVERIRPRFNYNVGAVISVTLVFLIGLGIVALIALPLINYVITLVEKVPEAYVTILQPALEGLIDDVEALTKNIQGPVGDAIKSAIPNLISSLGSFLTNMSAKVISGVSSLATSLPSTLLRVLIGLIASYFIALDFDRMTDFCRMNLSRKVLKVSSKIKNSLVTIIWQFIRSYFLIFVITAVEITVGLMLLKKSNALLFGILIAVFDAFPIVGSGMILLPWAVITIITSGFLNGLGLLVLYLVVVVVRQIIEPKIVGKQVGLRPIVTLFGMYVGSKLFGVLGLFGLPITAAIISDLNDEGTFRLYNKIEDGIGNRKETKPRSRKEKNPEGRNR